MVVCRASYSQIFSFLSQIYQLLSFKLFHRNVQRPYVDDRNLKMCYGWVYMLRFDYLKKKIGHTLSLVCRLPTPLLGFFCLEHCALPIATQGEIHLFGWNGVLRCSSLCSAVLATATEEDAGGRERGSFAGGGERAAQHIIYRHLTILEKKIIK